jgi:hypothetical protein
MSTRRGSRRPAVLTLAKDVGAWLLGVGLIIHQAGFVPPEHFNLTLTLVGATLVGVPGASQLLALRFGTAPSPSEQPAEGSGSPSPSSSPAA